MKKVIQLLPLFIMGISGYVWIIAASIETESSTFASIALYVFIGLFIVNFIYAIILSAFKKSGDRTTLITVFITKMLFVPLFIAIFITAVLLILVVIVVPSYLFIGVIAAPVLFLLAYALVISTSIYSLVNLIWLYKQNPSQKLFLITAVCCVCQFIFVADFIALLVYIIITREN